jgi:molecular chaperone GrpE
MESMEFPENTIMYEAQSGYTLHDKVIRPAMVVVSTGTPADAQVDKQSDKAETNSTEEMASGHNPFLQ